MFSLRTSVICPILCLAIVLTACVSENALTPSHPSPTASRPVRVATVTPEPTPTATQGADTTPARYTSRILWRGAGRPDDLAFDQQGRLLFSDFYNGTITRVNANGSLTVLARGLAGPEGLVMLADGTLIIAEQRTNRILSLAPGSQLPLALRTLPGIPSGASCKDGVDGIAWDPHTRTLIVPDSPTGNVYRMSLDGMHLTLLASGITRPVGATVDAAGNVYIADECGAAVWRVTPGGKKLRLGGFGMPDDVELDKNGNILVIDLAPAIHALIRVRATTGKHEVLASRGLIEPQGLAIDEKGDLFVSDDYANVIMEYQPV